MTLKTVILLTFFMLGSLTTRAQNTVDKDKLKNDFVTDSLGCSGQRLAYIDMTTKYLDTLTNKTRTKILINSLDLLNQQADKLMTLLGKPNDSSERSESTKKGKYYSVFTIAHYWYYLTTCGKDKKGKILVVTAYNGRIGDIDVIENN